MKVVFVDIDGPLVTMDEPQMTKFGLHNIFNPKCVEALNDIWRFTGCELVISSDWCINNFPSLKAMRQYFSHNYVLAPIIGFVRKLPSNALNLEPVRCQEILEWVQTHRPDRWVAIDDMNLVDLNHNFFHVDPIDGLAATGLKDRIIEFLNS